MDPTALAENIYMCVEGIKEQQGILDYSLNLGGHASPPSEITWKITGNPGVEQHAGIASGPLNEGAVFAERQGYLLLGALGALSVPVARHDRPWPASMAWASGSLPRHLS